MRRVAGVLCGLVLLVAACKKDEASVDPVVVPDTAGSPAVVRDVAPVPAQVQYGTLTVIFEPGDDRIFNVNDEPFGRVNVPNRISAGTYRIDLGEPRNYEPESEIVSVDEQESTTVTFRRTDG